MIPVLFDLDGTLVDSRADLTTAINLMRADYELPPLPLEVVTLYVGNGIHKLVERALKDTGAAPLDAVERTRRYYSEHLVDQTRLYPGVAIALERLHAKQYPLGIITNKPVQPARRILETLGILRLFGTVIGGDSCPRLKPHPEPVLKAVAALGCASGTGWIVGDNYTDLAAARQTGMKSCYCRYGFGTLGTETFTTQVDNLEDFADLLIQD